VSFVLVAMSYNNGNPTITKKESQKTYIVQQNEGDAAGYDISAAVDDEIIQKHLNWTWKQGSILSGGGRAEEYFTAERGFPFSETDLPHYHLLQNDTHTVFEEWKLIQPPCALVCGAWHRPLFAGGWQHSSDYEERVYNIQTHNLFIDLRIPKTMESVLCSNLPIQDRTGMSLEKLTPYQLRLYARQHVFAGFTVLSQERQNDGNHQGSQLPVATRHHCIDWNFIGVSRPRPNKWWIQVQKERIGTIPIHAWKEFAYATDDMGQHYYFEQWQRYPRGSDAEGGRLALRLASSRKRKSNSNRINEDDDDNNNDDNNRPFHQPRDGIFVLVGDHFNYIHSRTFEGNETTTAYYDGVTSLVDLVDASVARGDLITARSFLSIQAGHGTVSSGWTVDCAIPPWNQGRSLTETGIMSGRPVLVIEEEVEVEGNNDLASCSILWNGEHWDIYDCSFDSIQDLQRLLESMPEPKKEGGPGPFTRFNHSKL
jgi:hypothetical protein